MNHIEVQVLNSCLLAKSKRHLFIVTDLHSWLNLAKDFCEIKFNWVLELCLLARVASARRQFFPFKKNFNVLSLHYIFRKLFLPSTG